MPNRAPSGGRGGGRRSSNRGGRGGRGHGYRQPQASTKFKGNCADLQGHIFDCSDNKQADNYVRSVKRISEYVGSEYKSGGDIRSSIVNEQKVTIPVPVTPTYSAAYPRITTQEDRTKEMIFKGKIDAYIKRQTILDDNIQKAYSLVLGQCTELLQSKLKQNANWQAISVAQDVIRLLAQIKTICYKFEEQKFLPLSLYRCQEVSIRSATRKYVM